MEQGGDGFVLPRGGREISRQREGIFLDISTYCGGVGGWVEQGGGGFVLIKGRKMKISTKGRDFPGYFYILWVEQGGGGSALPGGGREISRQREGIFLDISAGRGGSSGVL